MKKSILIALFLFASAYTIVHFFQYRKHEVEAAMVATVLGIIGVFYFAFAVDHLITKR